MPGGDRARRHDHHVGACLHPAFDRFGQHRQPARVEHTGRCGQRGGADPPGFPYSNVRIRKPGYLTDYPDWTRLVLAQGNLFDVFADRTPDSPAADRVVGARAGVRWVDATAGATGVASHNPLEPRPGPTLQPFLRVQPFFRQQYLSRWHNPQQGNVDWDEWNAPYAPTVASFYGGPAIAIAGQHDWRIGRVDLAHIRCCDQVGSDEVAVLLRYQRFALDYTGIAGNPLAGEVCPRSRPGPPVSSTWPPHGGMVLTPFRFLRPARAWLIRSERGFCQPRRDRRLYATR